jgi:hypothetical protein
MAGRAGWGTILVIGPCGGEVARLALPGRGSPDLGAVDAVARLALAARRRGFSLRVDAEPELAAVLALAGLDAEVVGLEVAALEVGVLEVGVLEGAGPDLRRPDRRPLRPGGLGIEVPGQPEGGVEVGIEEVVVPDDPAV